MISDTERREIARKLREIERHTLCELTDGELIDFLVDAVGFNRYTNEDFDEGLLGRIADLIDRQTCRNVYDEYEMGACANGFQCSVCGNRVEDFEHYCITGTFNYCPKCGEEVVS